MSDLLQQIGQSIRRHGLLRPGQAALVAVSGGLDSMVLLDVLAQLCQSNGWRLGVAHLNHQLRGRSSAADERLVRAAAAKLGLPVVVERAAVRDLARREGISIEMAARRARHEFLARTASRLGVPTIALAHHADDQIELCLLRLLRGSGGDGLAGMKWRSPSPCRPEIALVRPLLDLPKAALAEYAAGKKVRFRTDATNACLEIQRNRIRHELLPLLRAKYQPALDKTLFRVMDIVGAEAQLATAVARAWLAARLPWRQSNGSNELNGLNGLNELARGVTAGKRGVARGRRGGTGVECPFDQLPVAVQRRCLQLQLISQGVAVDFELIEQLRLFPGKLVSVAANAGEGGCLENECTTRARGTGGTTVPRLVRRDSSGLLCFQSPAAPEFKGDSLVLDLQGRVGNVTFAGLRLNWRLVDGKGTERPPRQAGREYFDADRVGSPVVLRHWQPGDRFQPIGLRHAVKLQDWFTNQKVPRGGRHERVVAVSAQGELFWVEGLRISDRFKLTSATNRRLHWAWDRV